MVTKESSKKRILNVDSKKNRRYLSTEILMRSGYEVREAAGGREALKLSQELPDLIILEAKLPDIDGFEVCRRLKADSHTASIPVVLLAGRSLFSIGRRKKREEGEADGYLVRPVEPQELLSTVKALLRLKEIESSLHQSEALFRNLAENTQDIFYHFRLLPEKRFEYISPSISSITGYTPEEHYADPDLSFKIVHPDDRHLLEAAYRGQIPEDRLLSLRWKRKDGTVIWTEQRHVPIYNEAGELVAIEGITRDISDRKQVEEKLRESEAKYKTLIDGMNDTAWVIGYDGKFIDVNDTACKIFGYSREEFLTMGPHDIDVSLKADEINGLVARMPTEAMQLFTTTHCTRDGKKIPVEIKSTLITYHGQPAILSIARDITERKKVEQELQRRLMELEALQKISSALRLAETLEDMLPVFLDETLSLLNTDAGAIWLYHSSSGALRFAVTRSWFSLLEEPSLKPVEDIIGSVFRSGQAYVSREFAADPLLKLAEGVHIPEGWGGVCLPIRNVTETEGVLFISVPLPREISPDEVKLLTSLSDMVGVAINRLSLYEETVRRLKQVQSLHAVDLAINASLDLRLTLDVLLEQVSDQLAVDTAVVFLLHPQLKILEYAAGRGVNSAEIKKTCLRLGEGPIGRAALERRTVLVSSQAEAPDDMCAAFMQSEGFVANASVPLISKGEVKGVLGVYSRKPFYHDIDWLNFLETLAGQAAIAVDNARLFENLQQANLELLTAYDATIEGWAHFLELRDKETEGHSQRVTQMTLAMAKQLGIKAEKLVHVRRGALLHDIGKMGIPDSVLQKQGLLTKEEWEIMHRHPQFAYEMLSSIEYLRPALEIPYCHHENWDGTGYPRGLKGEAIPLEARIFAVVDVYDALTSDRPYRLAWTEEQALQYIHEQKGKQFDPQVVELFLKQKSFTS